MLRFLNGGVPIYSNLRRDFPCKRPPSSTRPIRLSQLTRRIRFLLWFISTIPILATHPPLVAQGVTTPTPPPLTGGAPSQNFGEKHSAFPDLSTVPFAVPLPPPNAEHISEDSDLLSQHGSLDLLSGDVEIHFRNHEIRADSMELNRETQEVTATGHLRLTGGDNDEYIEASHGTYNLRTGTGRFFDATGSVGLHNAQSGAAGTGAARMGLESSNPFLFAGRIVEKTGPSQYTIVDGTVTSCLLPRPDWLFTSQRLAVDNGRVHATYSTFRLLGAPVLFLPYLTAPVTAGQRESGLLIPVLGDSSTKGITIGEQAYFALGRSADLAAGLIYYSLRGYSESGTFRYRGAGLDFITGHISALQDRGYTANNGVYVNQGGEDLSAAFRRQLTPNTRLVGDGEYLSSYAFREAFTENFNQAVSSDITSLAFITHQSDGWSADGRVDRYQGLKRVAINATPGQQVHILHVPSLDLDGVDRPLAGTPFRWTLNASAAGLKRAQPNFTSSGITERFDLRPELSLPLHFDGWSLRASIAARETVYSRSRSVQAIPGTPPTELSQSLNRADVELEAAIRPPALQRSFAVPARLQALFGTEVRHTIEPEMTYREVRGVNNFLNVLRFDENDLVSDTDQLEYGLTQHLYFRPKPSKPALIPLGCPTVEQRAGTQGAEPEGVGPTVAGGATESAATAAEEPVPDVLTPGPADSTDANGIPLASAAAPDTPLQTHARHAQRCTSATPTAQQPLLSWRLTQRYFFDPTFGHAVLTGRRNLFESTLSLSGIAFLTEPRNISPLISRLRVRTSGHTDVEWDFDLDTGAGKFTSSNVFLDAHEGPIFGGLSYARLNAPGRFATEVLDTNANASLVTSPVSNFSQLRVLLGYGVPSRPGLSTAANVGLDALQGTVQYGALQTSYNWNCCGLAVEYRKFNLGTVRNENSYRFNFTLANIGSAGNIRRAERLF